MAFVRAAWKDGYPVWKSGKGPASDAYTSWRGFGPEADMTQAPSHNHSYNHAEP